MTYDTDLNDYIEMLEAELLRKRISDRLHGKLSKLVKQTSPIDRTKPKMSEGRNILKMIKDKINDE
mgnify:FL=1